MGKSVKIVDEWFKQKHMDIVEKLRTKPRIQLDYVLTLLHEKEKIIESIF